MAKTGRKWSDDEDCALLALHKEGKTTVDIATALGRPMGGVEHRLALHGLRATSFAAWRREEETTLLDMRDRGCSWEAIGRRLRRSADACINRHKRIAEQEQRTEAYVSAIIRSDEADNRQYLAACMREAGLVFPATLGHLRAWYRARCEHDVPPDFRPAKTQVSFAATSSLMGSTMAMCSEVA